VCEKRSNIGRRDDSKPGLEMVRENEDVRGTAIYIEDGFLVERRKVAK